MIAYIVALLLLSLALLAMTLEKAYFYVPYRELKRLAVRRDAISVTLFQAAAYGDELKLLLFTTMGVSAAGGFVLFSRIAPPVFGFVCVGLVLLVAYVWLPRTHLSQFGAQLAVWSVPLLLHVLRILHPVSERIVRRLTRFQASGHTGLYEHDDMVGLLEQQALQADNRMSEQELSLMRQVIQFGSLTTADVLVPRKQVKAVSIDDDISPVFLAELHESGHPRFPVYDGKKSNIVGTLPVDMVADVKHHGKVRDTFDHHLAYLHEKDSLEHALRAFYETGQHLFVIVNNRDEYVGIVTLSDILHKLFGAIEEEAFGRHYDREAVAHRYDQPNRPPAEKASTNTTEVVE